ncbi:cold shock domain-containing protein [Crenothrix sp.]|uniref:cold shock domain-containing protein n=1 Tax=Crenothrix sp. TaxID=3100433 RepID=UPI00374D73D0
MIEKGRLVRWIDDKGFGFIKPEDGKAEIFLHISALKGMSRKPVVGDIIHYLMEVDANGKSRAVNAKIEGVTQILKLTALEQKRQTASLSQATEKPYRNQTTKVSKAKNSFYLLPILVAIGGAVFVYDKVFQEKIPTVQAEKLMAESQSINQTTHFQCQGKVWCTQMSSYEEAKFYLDNCPGTKMDGDGDGEPCEQQF